MNGIGKTEPEAEIQHIGLHARRLADNPREKAFAEQWQWENRSINLSTTTGYPAYAEPTLEVLLGRKPTQAEATAVATVIQWLGSNVGWDLIADATCRWKLYTGEDRV